MIANKGRFRTRVRSLFVSDVHVGCPHARVELLTQFLAAYHPRRLYIVGDFIDGWKLRRSFRWQPSDTRLLKQLLAMAQEGTEICYAPGNHDAFLREFLEDLGVVQLADEFIHVSPMGRRFLVLHGDRFDWVETHAPWLSWLSSQVYRWMLWGDRGINFARRRPQGRYQLCGWLKSGVKGMVRHFSRFEQALVEAARARGCGGIVCGHIHQPRIAVWGDVVYCNTGDWVENCTAMIEYEDGRLELIASGGTCLGQSAERILQPASSDWVASHFVRSGERDGQDLLQPCR